MRQLGFGHFIEPATAYHASARRMAEAFADLQYAIKYDENQPRAPAGHPDGGQWIHKDTSSQADTSELNCQNPDDVARIANYAKLHMIASKPRGYQRCLDFCYPLLERFKNQIWTDKTPKIFTNA